MLPPEVVQMLTWAGEGIVTFLFLAVIYFLKKMVDQHDANRKNIHRLRVDLARKFMRFEVEILRTRQGARILAERLHVRYHDIDGLCDESMKIEQDDGGDGDEKESAAISD
jgi:hypothetical protein